MIVLAALFAYRCVHISLEAERTLHAYYAVIDVLRVYLQENSGRWPTSWDEMATVELGDLGGGFAWPRDRGQIENRVFVDFSVTGAAVGKMDAEHFSVVQPLGPNYGPREENIAELIEVARCESEKSADGSPQ
jgi:hypothetical protein